jgi:hypothetical protein
MRAKTSAGKATVAGMLKPASDHLETTRQFWEARSGSQLTIEDARQIAENVKGFFRLLAQWDVNTPGV